MKRRNWMVMTSLMRLTFFVSRAYQAGQDYLFQGKAKINKILIEVHEKAFLSVPAGVKATTLFL